MSELLDRLRAASSESGRASADQLASAAVVDAMAERVRAGVRRRRVTAAVAGGVTAIAVTAAAVVVPGMLEPPAVDVAPASRNILNTDGALTVYDDGSISVVASNGRVVDVTPPEGASLGIEPRTQRTLCAIDTESLDSGWHWQDEHTGQRLVGFGSANSVDGDDWKVISPELTVDSERLYSIGFAVDVDPAIAEFVVIQLSLVDAVDGVAGHVQTTLTGDAEVVAQSTGASAAEIATVLHSNVMHRDYLGYCVGKGEPEIKPLEVPIDVYMVADVWLTDRAGTAVLLGTHVTRVTTYFEAGE